MLKDPKIAQRPADGGSLVDGSTPAEYAALIKRELELRQRIAKRPRHQAVELNSPAGRAASSASGAAAPDRCARTAAP